MAHDSMSLQVEVMAEGQLWTSEGGLAALVIILHPRAGETELLEGAIAKWSSL